MGEIELLNKAFTDFADASRSLETYYRGLEAEVRSLRLEVEEKNRELAASLNEAERSRIFLNQVLEGLPSAVFVFSPEGDVLHGNSTARRLLEREGPVRNVLDLPFDLAEAEAELKDEEGREVHAMLTHCGVGEIGSALIVQDITRLKQLEGEAELNRRLAAMGELVAKIAHEIRNPLGSIELFASMLSEDLDGTPLKEVADGISTGVRSLVNTLSNMLLYTRTQRIRRRPLDLLEITDRFIRQNEALARRNDVELLWKPWKTGLPVEGDPELIGQILYNLVLNAVQAMPAGGVLTVEAESAGPEYHRLIVTDTGTGISADQIDRIFEPFHSTKDRGNGLGLSIVRAIMRDHDGLVRVESEAGRGTTFTLLFPKALHGA